MGSVEVTNCFCIPHKEYEERVEADIVYAQDMYELNRKVAPHETLVGWFATGSEITSQRPDPRLLCQRDERSNPPDAGHNSDKWPSHHEGLCLCPTWCPRRHLWIHVHASPG